MISTFRIFVDSDVVISSLISSSGASYFLLHTERLELLISNLSYKELRAVTARLGIDKKKLKNLIDDKFRLIQIKETIKELKKKYANYTKDPNDTHIVAGAIKARANFLISYNLRDFKIDLIKKDFGVLCLTPSRFLQYLRSAWKIA